MRLIPARAGKTLAFHAWVSAMRAHPRAGGENPGFVRLGDLVNGSSPRGRGKLEGRLAVLGGQRLIPARAGKTLGGNLLALLGGAHPRAGGENSRAAAHSAGTGGSSPRGRGKLVRTPRFPARFRLIPARAGKTRSRMMRSISRRAHPRAGGENTYLPTT